MQKNILKSIGAVVAGLVFTCEWSGLRVRRKADNTRKEFEDTAKELKTKKLTIQHAARHLQR